jgi:hypothetical protein
MEINQPATYESMTGKKARKPLVEVEPNKEDKKIDTSLDAYQKQRDAERQAELEKARAKQKQEVKFTFEKPRKDFSIYGGWVNAYEPINKGKLGSSQSWRVEKKPRFYY